MNAQPAEDGEKPWAVILCENPPWHGSDIIDYVYGFDRIQLLRRECTLYPTVVSCDNWDDHLEALAQAEVIFTTWGMWCLNDAEMNAMPKLRAVFHAAGATDALVGPFQAHGIPFFGTAEANAIPVAEFCLAQILLSTKGYFTNTSLCRQGPWDQATMPVGQGNYGETIALLAIGAVSRHLIHLLQPFQLNIIAVSDYLDDESALELGINRLVDFETAFREALVVSNHLPDLPELKGIYRGHHFASMREGATFINTGRGAQVKEDELIEVLRQRPDLTMLLDVQNPEPPPMGSPLYTLPNVHLTSHIAGSVNNEVRRLADSVIEEFRQWKQKRIKTLTGRY